MSVAAAQTDPLQTIMLVPLGLTPDETPVVERIEKLHELSGTSGVGPLEMYLLLVNATREKMSATLGIPAGCLLGEKIFGRGNARLVGSNKLEISFNTLDVAIFKLNQQ